jgi:hypothetical protein
MNTLPRAITARFFPEPDHYCALRDRWRWLLASDQRTQLTPAHHLLYLALRGRDWRRAFTPIRNPRKLANGAFPGWALFRALDQIQRPWHEEWLLAPFDGIVTPAMLAALRLLLPQPKPARLDPLLVAQNGLPFVAYLLPEEPAHG